MTPEQRKTIIFIEDNALIKGLLVENCRTMPRQGTANFCAICLRDEKRGKLWYISRFFDPDDDGYVAIGIALDSPREFQNEISNMILRDIRNKVVTQAAPLKCN